MKTELNPVLILCSDAKKKVVWQAMRYKQLTENWVCVSLSPPIFITGWLVLRRSELIRRPRKVRFDPRFSFRFFVLKWRLASSVRLSQLTIYREFFGLPGKFAKDTNKSSPSQLPTEYVMMIDDIQSICSVQRTNCRFWQYSSVLKRLRPCKQKQQLRDV